MKFQINYALTICIVFFSFIAFSQPSTFDLHTNENNRSENLLLNMNKINSISVNNTPGTIIEDQILTAQNITLLNSPNSIIRNNIIYGFTTFVGIYVSNCSNSIIENNIFYNLYNDASSKLMYGMYISASNNVTIIHNNISNLTSQSAVTGIGLFNSNNSVIEYNSITNFNNTNGVTGIGELSGNNVTISSNYVSNLKSAISTTSGLTSIVGTNKSITNNTITKIDSHASTGCCYLSIGISSYGIVKSAINNNSIDSITGSQVVYVYGMYMRYNNQTDIINNSITNVKSFKFSYGIVADISNYNLTFSYNKLENISTDSDSTYGMGLVGSNLTITNNLLVNIGSLNKNTNAYGISTNANLNVKIVNNSISSVYAKTQLVGIAGSGNNLVTINNSFSNLISAGSLYPYLIYYSNNSFISIPEFYTFNMINFVSKSLNSLNYSVKVNGETVLTGYSFLISGAILDFRNITSTTNQVVVSFTGSGVNETYLMTLLKPLTPAHTMTQPKFVTPINSTTIIDQKNLFLEWNPVIDSFNLTLAYALYYSNDSMSTWNLISQNINSNNYTISLTDFGLTTNQTIFIKLIASDSYNLTNMTIVNYNLTFIIPHILTAPKIMIPTNATEFVNKTFIFVTWNSASDSYNHTLTYNLYYSTNNTNNWALIVQNIHSNSYNISLSKLGLVTNQTVFIKLVAMDGNNLENNTIVSYKLNFIIESSIPANETATTIPTTSSTLQTPTTTSSTQPTMSSTNPANSFDLFEVVSLLLVCSIAMIKKRRFNY